MKHFRIYISTDLIILYNTSDSNNKKSAIMGNWLTKIDQNPYVLQLNYQGDSHHTSKTGGFISLIYFIIILTFLGYSLS